MTHAEKAKEYFSNNFNCAQAVFTTFAVENGFDEALALKLASGFGGGARCGQLCGAVSGALMVLGLKYGHSHSTDRDEKARSNSLAMEFTTRFREKNGSVVCRELLGYDPSDPADAAVIREKDLFHTICPRMVADAADIVDQMLAENG